jgi:DUF2993 family protein
VRGCLGVLILAAVFVVAGAWFGGPPIAETLVTTGLTSSGMRSDDLKVDVHAEPPLRLALGRADEIDVDGSDVEWNGLTADTLHLELNNVDFLGRSAAHVNGRLTGVELPNVDPPGSKATVDISGPGSSAVVTITIDDATVERMAAAAFEQKLGVRPTSTTLSEPNVIRFKAGPVQAAGALTIGPGGSLDVSTALGTVTVLEPSPSQPIHLTSVAVESGNLVLTGTFDVAELMG